MSKKWQWSAWAFWLAFIFLLVANFSNDPIKSARSWVVWPIFLATFLICSAIEDNQKKE